MQRLLHYVMIQIHRSPAALLHFATLHDTLLHSGCTQQSGLQRGSQGGHGTCPRFGDRRVEAARVHDAREASNSTLRALPRRGRRHRVLKRLVHVTPAIVRARHGHGLCDRGLAAEAGAGLVRRGACAPGCTHARAVLAVEETPV